jgi:eukaryotic-like serine/threonine-protein kinase
MEQPSPPAAGEPAAAVMVGGYRVLGRLAVGGMSELFMAEEAVDGEALRYVVIKLLPAGGVEAEAERLFLREGRTLLRLDHPNVCHSYAFGKVGARCYIAMEWIDGVSLRELLLAARDAGRSLSYALSANLIAQVAAGLEHAHTARDSQRTPLRVVHRDVNPTNVMIRHDGVVKLIDFGVAQVAERRGSSDPQTVRGKLAYMAPEQVRGGEVDHHADIFALGVCLYELLTGTRLYRRGSREATADAVLDEPVPSPRAVAPELPEQLDAIVQRALQKDPVARFSSAGELGAALEDYLVSVGEPMGARPLATLMRALFPHHNGQPRLDLLSDLAERFSDPGPLPSATSPASELPPREPDAFSAESEPSESRVRARAAAYDAGGHSGVVATVGAHGERAVPARTASEPPRASSSGAEVAPRERRGARVLALSGAAAALLALGVYTLRDDAPRPSPAEHAPDVEPAAPSSAAGPVAPAVAIEASAQAEAAPENPQAPAVVPAPSPAAEPPASASSTGVSSEPSAERKTRARRRRASPGFIADPGF